MCIHSGRRLCQSGEGNAGGKCRRCGCLSHRRDGRALCAGHLLWYGHGAYDGTPDHQTPRRSPDGGKAAGFSAGTGGTGGKAGLGPLRDPGRAGSGPAGHLRRRDASRAGTQPRNAGGIGPAVPGPNFAAAADDGIPRSRWAGLSARQQREDRCCQKSAARAGEQYRHPGGWRHHPRYPARRLYGRGTEHCGG